MDHSRARPPAPARPNRSDPAAFVLHRGWVGPAVRFTLTDPADPTPYWLFSTRKPQRVVELLRGA
ncbi:DUF3093 family protein [Amycolatopsis echigonensis]|uniref:DUF3093 family protein n=1 Tax=Amycolatopsis echigonensis TaxID=2576905 RepID=UPI003A520A4E